MIDCTQWTNPGADPYSGSVVAAVVHYQDVPLYDRARLMVQMLMQGPVAYVTITKTGIESSTGAASNLRDMHYGGDKVCRGEVSRKGWKDGHVEPAAVYCIGASCVAVPSVCGNVTRIDYLPGKPVPVPDERVWNDFAPAPGYGQPQFYVERGPVVGVPWGGGGEGSESVHAVPEPASWALVLMGLVAAGLARKRT